MSNRSKKYGVPGEISACAIRGQIMMFDEARKLGFTPTILETATEIPRTTIKAWADGTAMPITGFAAIAGIKDFPNHLLSLVLDAAGKEIGDNSEEEDDYDDLARAALDYASEHARARHPDSEGGIRLVHTETPGLKLKARALKTAAKKVAA